MRHRFALAVSVLLLGPVAAFAQTHPQHAPGQQHDRGSHPPMDSQQHALLHGMLLGTWTGTLTSPDGGSTRLTLAATNDQHGKLTLKPASLESKDVGDGGARDVVLDGHTVRWTQALSGVSCKASATVTAATTQDREMLKGTMTCPQREMTFALAKTKTD